MPSGTDSDIDTDKHSFTTALDLQTEVDTGESDVNPCVAGTIRCNGPDSELRPCPKCVAFREIRDALREGSDP